jgi:hypothetical protein
MKPKTYLFTIDGDSIWQTCLVMLISKMVTIYFVPPLRPPPDIDNYSSWVNADGTPWVTGK